MRRLPGSRDGHAGRPATRGITVEEARRRSTSEGDPELTSAMTALLAIVA
ncbi:hypothetical protein [Actinomadura madurae]|nr:hypothetical protein [Actinomadura madurae]MCP9951717.1 hypothetical protein [Actinomadura madurae]MCP9968486.1 hypothetical protein [Actinomadura madurae]MCP9980959.1 hypothetical protein [Actinomadura madurae]MCQ0017154.1 hypothetical protein [Actinomadura madurae]URN07999.1 hypothetical protein LUW74_34635 [Actinomadura madurae]